MPLKKGGGYMPHSYLYHRLLAVYTPTEMYICLLVQPPEAAVCEFLSVHTFTQGPRHGHAAAGCSTVYHGLLRDVCLCVMCHAGQADDQKL